MGTHYSHVTEADRMSIQALLQAKLSGPEIARQLDFSRSTINREINRSKATPIALAKDYQAGPAQVRSRGRRGAAGASRRKLGSDTQSPLWRTVVDGLRCHWSPQQIAGKLPRMNKVASAAAGVRIVRGRGWRTVSKSWSPVTSQGAWAASAVWMKASSSGSRL